MLQESRVISTRSSERLIAVSTHRAHGRVSRNLKPLLILVVLFAVVAGMAALLNARAAAIVRAPGVVYPAAYAILRQPVTSYGQNTGRIAEVWKRNGETVPAGEPLLRMDTSDEMLQREQTQRQIQGYLAALKDHEGLRAERALRVQWANALVETAAAELAAEKARLGEALALLKRAGTVSVDLEVKVAREKLTYAQHGEEEARITYDNYKVMPRTALSEEDLRKAKLAWEQATSLRQQYAGELALLEQADTVVRLETAQAQVAYRQAAVLTAQSRVEERRKEVQLLEAARDLDTQARMVEGDLAKARVEEERLNRAIAEKTLRAPVGGVVQNFHVQAGQWVTTRDVLGYICDTTALMFQAQIPQADLVRVQTGQRARVYFDSRSGTNGVYDAEVVEIGSMLAVPGAEGSDPLGLLPQLPTRALAPAHGVAHLKLLGPAGAPAGAGKLVLRPGCAGQVRILVGAGELAEFFY
jgi:multidrug resistance efflux pump